MEVSNGAAGSLRSRDAAEEMREGRQRVRLGPAAEGAPTPKAFERKRKSSHLFPCQLLAGCDWRQHKAEKRVGGGAGPLTGEDRPLRGARQRSWFGVPHQPGLLMAQSVFCFSVFKTWIKFLWSSSLPVFFLLHSQFPAQEGGVLGLRGPRSLP